ncbi:protein amalgam-like isoform X2 [Ischnura elegans]|uniref:protein amalgam-like isoform X2 n=1 Tax=Ischnura elegans TaxID=197161 RepID=UPI001ED8A236|nr:protein amalgam-like isoform X2 [Ischnura elegans]
MAKLSLKLFLLALLAVMAAKVAASPVDKGGDDYDDYPGDSNDQFDEEEEEEEEYLGPPPVIHTESQLFEVKPGAKVMLPCNVSNSDPNVVVMWLKGGQPLFSDFIRMTFNKRYERLSDNTLQIKDVTVQDSGEYICELSTPDKLHVNHALHVFAAPKIVNVLPGPNKIIKKGETLTLKCEVEGYPEPEITWSKKGKHLPTGEETKVATSITFVSVDRHHNGTYECIAENTLGRAKTTIDIRVQYSPEIKIEKELVNTAEGHTSEITCTVHAEPKAKVFWYKEGILLHPSERIMETRIGSRHTLKINDIRAEDFGVYTCTANNSIGRNKMVAELSGVPSRAQFISTPPKMPNENSQVLSWTVESSSPIISYNLTYRKKNTDETKTMHPEVVNPDGNVYTVVAEIPDVGEGVYEATLLSENQYGWSNPSAWESFSGKPMLEESKGGSGVEGLRPSIVTSLLIALLAYFHV